MLLLMAAVILTVSIGDYTDAAVIAMVIVVNTTVGVVQEVRADRAVTALASLSAPLARVIRDGRQQEIAAADVVPGDALVLAEGSGRMAALLDRHQWCPRARTGPSSRAIRDYRPCPLPVRLDHSVW
jgi:hypothetical protein